MGGRSQINDMQNVVQILSVVLLFLLAMPAAAQEPEINGLAADKPLSTYSHDTIKGGITFTTGNSDYSGNMFSGDTYNVDQTVSIPEGTVVKLARLYSYWTWSGEGSTGKYPDMKVTFDTFELEPDQKYNDRKRWGPYDYPSGTWAYDVTEHITGSGTYTIVVENTGPSGAFFALNGIGLVVVYTDTNGKDIEYWINEGCDMLNSQMNDDGSPKYYTTPEQTITELMKPTISQATIKSASLWTIIQSANWDENALKVNGKEWSGIYGGIPHPGLDIDSRDITAHLNPGENNIQFQAVGDLAVPSGSLLVVEYDSSSDGGLQESGQQDISTTNDVPGFGGIFSIVLVLSAVYWIRKGDLIK